MDRFDGIEDPDELVRVARETFLEFAPWEEERLRDFELVDPGAWGRSFSSASPAWAAASSRMSNSSMARLEGPLSAYTTAITRCPPITGKTAHWPERGLPTTRVNPSGSPVSSKVSERTAPSSSARVSAFLPESGSRRPRVSCASGCPLGLLPKAPSAVSASRRTRNSTARSTDSLMMFIRLSEMVVEMSPLRRSPTIRRSLARFDWTRSAREAPPVRMSLRACTRLRKQEAMVAISPGIAATTPAA